MTDADQHAEESREAPQAGSSAHPADGVRRSDTFDPATLAQALEVIQCPYQRSLPKNQGSTIYDACLPRRCPAVKSSRFCIRDDLTTLVCNLTPELHAGHWHRPGGLPGHAR